MTPRRAPAVAYTPGRWVLVVGDRTVVVLPPETAAAAGAVRLTLEGADGLAVVVRALPAALATVGPGADGVPADLFALPGFAVLRLDDDAAHVVVRGPITVRRTAIDPSGGLADHGHAAAPAVSGVDALTWAEGRLPGGGRFTVELPGDPAATDTGTDDAAASGSDRDWRLLVDGAALAGGIRIETLTAASAPSAVDVVAHDATSVAAASADVEPEDAAPEDAAPVAAEPADDPAGPRPARVMEEPPVDAAPVSTDTIAAPPTGEQPRVAATTTADAAERTPVTAVDLPEELPEAPAAANGPGAGNGPDPAEAPVLAPSTNADAPRPEDAPPVPSRPRTLIDAVPWRLDEERFARPPAPAATSPTESTVPPAVPVAEPGGAPAPPAVTPASPAPRGEPVDAGEDHDGLTLTGAQQEALRAARRSTPGGPRAVFATGDIVPLDGGITVLGRRPALPEGTDPAAVRLVTVPSPQADVSRSHLRIERVADGWRATDLHSTNGTVLTHPGEPARRLQEGRSLLLRSGDGIDLGDGVTATLEDLA
ncbi:hypothetical protein GCM10011512_25020 [Tersicoccus solisilvae]|uniref:FHA domain-containing protein n=1 Tax=Tersicoccus solisilvae TaxID=1882339 RepID=A0ABQ1PGU8_9MICC|nr:FHA domain-containing protein [Tersicoccus solisilvae]GGC97001.1 hypothetical protein GCM10011512_25020 [Tersicoccus solisilvae]